MAAGRDIDNLPGSIQSVIESLPTKVDDPAAFFRNSEVGKPFYEAVKAEFLTYQEKGFSPEATIGQRLINFDQLLDNDKFTSLFINLVYFLKNRYQEVSVDSIVQNIINRAFAANVMAMGGDNKAQETAILRLAFSSDEVFKKEEEKATNPEVGISEKTKANLALAEQLRTRIKEKLLDPLYEEIRKSYEEIRKSHLKKLQVGIPGPRSRSATPRTPMSSEAPRTPMSSEASETPGTPGTPGPRRRRGPGF